MEWFVFHSSTAQYMPPEFSKSKQYDGCQGTVWQMEILLVDMLKHVVPAFKHPRHALRMSPRVPHQLSTGISFLISTYFTSINAFTVPFIINFHPLF